MSITEILPPGPIESSKDGDTLLELAFLMAAADGRLHAGEMAAYRELVSRVCGAPASESDVGGLVNRFSVTRGSAAIHARVRALGPTLPPELREVAFRVGMGLALADGEGCAEEDELVTVFVEALSIPLERAEVLAEEVRAAFGIE